MTIQNLLFTSADGSTLFATDGTTVTQLATNASTPALLHDPLLGNPISAVAAGSMAYFTMADSTDHTSAIWSYNGTAVTQITSSSNYVDTTQDANNTTAPAPMSAFGNDLAFSQASLTTGDDSGAYDHATLAIYNPTNGQITQPTTPNGGYDPQDFVTLNGVLYFEATDSVTHASAIYSFDGTTVSDVYNLDPTTSGMPAKGAVDGSLAVFNNHIYFGSGQQTIYELTGPNTAADESGGSNSGAENDSSSPSIDPVVSGDYLYFLANNSGVWSLDSSNVLHNLVGSRGERNFTPVDDAGTLYFVSGNYSPSVVDGTYVFPTGDGASTLFSSTGTGVTTQSANFSGSDLIAMGGEIYYNNNGPGLGTITGASTLGTLSVPGDIGGLPLIAVPFAATSWGTGPIVTAGAAITFIAGGAPVALDSGLTITNTVSATLASATISIGNHVAGDALDFTNDGFTEGNITGDYDAAAGVLTLTSAGATATLAQFQQALETVTYASGSPDPTEANTNASRTVFWAVNDGVNDSAVVTSVVTVHTPPAATAGATATFQGGGLPVTLDGSLALTDVDSANLTGATVSIANFVSGDMMACASPGGLSQSYDSSMGVLTLSGSATVAQYQAALDSIAYSTTPSNDDPTVGGTNTSRTIDWMVTDGVASSATVTSTLLTTHAAPAVTSMGDAPTFIVGSSAVVVDPQLLVSDPDSNGLLTGATVSVSSGTFADDGDMLAETATAGGITATYDPTTETLTLSGSDTLADYQAVLRGITYASSAADPTNSLANMSRQISWSVSDGVAASAVATDTVPISFSPPVINDTPASNPVTDETTVSPFSAVTITDPNPGQTESVSVALSLAANGSLASSLGGNYDPTTGIYTVSGTAADVTAAVDALVFTPTAHQVAPGSTTTTSFTINATDTLLATASDSATSVVATAVSDTPVISGVAAGQGTTDETTVTPFSGVLITDVDFGQTENVTVTLSDPADGTFSTLGDGGSYDPDTGIYAITGTATAVTAALRGLVFTPTPHSVAPGSSVTTGFALQVTDTAGATSSNIASSVIATAVNDPPGIAGTMAGQTSSDAAWSTPFSGVSISDVDVGQLETVTVTTGNLLNGALSNFGVGSYDSDTGVYTVAGTDAAVTAAVDGLVFTPTNHQVAPGASVITGFTIRVTDTAGASTINAITTVTAAASNDPPVIAGVTGDPQDTTDEATVTPFAGVSISDVDFGQTETVNIGLSNPLNGALSSSLGGGYNSEAGVYTITGTDADVTAAVDALVFTPAAHQVTPGDPVTTDFTINVADSSGATSANEAASVTATAVADPPVINGAASGQTSSDEETLTPFAGLSISNPDVGQTESVTIQLSDPANGALSNLGDGSYDGTTETYSFAGTDAAVTAELKGLVFTPTAHQVTPGDTVTTNFNLQVTDTAGAIATDMTTSVLVTAATDAPVISGAVPEQTGFDNATTMPFSGVAVSDADFGQTETVTVTLSDALNGTLANPDGGSYDSNAGVYTVTGTDSQVTTLLDGLVFTPTAHQVAPTDAVTTGFTIQATDTAGAMTTNATTTVITTAFTDLPVISGTESAQPTNDETATAPFAGVTISDVDFGQTETVVVTLSSVDNGSLESSAGGTYDGTTGIYTVTGTAADVTAAVDALVFTPTMHQVAPNSTVSTSFTLAVTNTAGATVSDDITSVVTTAVNDPPTIDLSDVNTGVPNQTGSQPFANMTVIDPDIGHIDTVTVTMSDATAGVFSNLGGGSYDAATGVYSVTGSAAIVTAALQALTFAPAAPANGLVTTTGFTVLVEGPGGSQSNNSIQVTSADQQHGLATSLPANVVASPDGSNFPAPVAGMSNQAVVTSPTDGATYTLPNGYQALLLGGSANATLTDPSGGNALLIGNTGNSTLISGAGNDTIVGVGGNTTIQFQSGASGGLAFGGPGNATMLDSGQNATLVGGDSSTTATLSGSSALFFGEAGAVTILNSGPNSTLVGGSGASAFQLTSAATGTFLFGGSGDQTISDAGSNNTLTGSAGTTAATVSGSAALFFSEAGAATVLNSGANSTLVGASGSSNFQMTSSATGTVLFGGSGALTVSDAGGSDTLIGGGGSTTATLSGTNAIFFNGTGTSAVVDTGENNTIVGSSGQIAVTSTGSGEMVFGGSGSLGFVGGQGGATIIGASGSTSVTGGAGGTTLLGGSAGAVSYTGSVGGLLYQAGAGAETLNASNSATNDQLYGGQDSNGADLIIGGAGNDTLTAGTGSDTLTGGSGQDVFVFLNANNGAAPSDQVVNFTSNDTVLLAGYGAGAASKALSTATSGGGSTTITLTDNTRITFSDLSSVSGLNGRIVSS